MPLIIKICMLALLCVTSGTVIKHMRPDFSPLVRVAGSITIITATLALIIPSVVYIKALFEGNELGEYAGMIIKALGIAILAQICADICRDCGEGSVASGVELVGRLEILVLCFPLIEKLLASVKEVMLWA